MIFEKILGRGDSEEEQEKTPAERQFDRYMEAYNRGNGVDEEELDAFGKQHPRFSQQIADLKNGYKERGRWYSTDNKPTGF